MDCWCSPPESTSEAPPSPGRTTRGRATPRPAVGPRSTPHGTPRGGWPTIDRKRSRQSSNVSSSTLQETILTPLRQSKDHFDGDSHTLSVSLESDDAAQCRESRT